MFLKYSTNTNDLFSDVIRLRSGGEAQPSTRESLGDPGSPDEWAVMAFHADSDRAVHTDVWERHPCGDEVLCVLSGAVRVSLRELADRSEPAVTVTAGRCFVVPAGRWHRLAVIEPADLLSITPPLGTEHEPVRDHQQSED